MSVVMLPRLEVAEATAPAAAPEQSGRIEIEALNLYYGGFRAVRDISMTIEPRSVTAIIGPSGWMASTSTIPRSTRSSSDASLGWSSSARTRSRRCRSSTTWHPGCG
jgi:ABC-type phosphate/phosphonate transport system ATPase subunit